MAEFIEVPVVREDGSEGLHYVNLEAISYAERVSTGNEDKILRVYLNNGYWFTLSGTKAGEVLNLIHTHLTMQSKDRTGDN